eukprot:CAMPEP_0119008958 /NCGR_PEP_ID=MMETSP1176-20130426/4046_1 /TAXON_ID=265551 /ORGANISM="Synedropsis recta cf, Strain CCMP1620" /LENGTH=148 /DNA_ID=CAMNT_0006961379 /DNA_START=52 /DNA_END=498 /DNA_ORIENTATION=-
MMNSQTIVALLLALTATSSNAFLPASRQSSVTTQLQFGIPTFGAKDTTADDSKSKKAGSTNDAPEPKIGLKGVLQLVMAGMGSPFLGDFEGVDKETGNLMFSLEANNLVDENGESKQTKMPYFENGWVDSEDLEKENAKGGFKFPWDK